MVAIEIFIFDRKSGLFEIGGQIVELDRSAILVVVDFVEEIAISVENFGRNRVGTGFV